MGIAEAVHVHGLDADAGAAVASEAGADAVACVFFAVAPFVQGKELAAHSGFVISEGNIAAFGRLEAFDAVADCRGAGNSRFKVCDLSRLRTTMQIAFLSKKNEGICCGPI